MKKKLHVIFLLFMVCNHIFSQGNIGIGTNAPAYKLDVVGDVNVNTGSGFRINGAATSGQYLRGDGSRFVQNSIQTGDLPANIFWGTSGNSGLIAPTSTIGTAVNNNFIGNTDAKDLVFATDNKERLRITSTGNIGIGTIAPDASALLDMFSSSKGVSFPNVNLLSNTDATTIALPKKGLVVYNTGATLSPAGLYINTGTTGSPTWQKLQDATGTLTGLSVTSPVTSTGGTTPTIGLGTVPVSNGGTGLTAIGAGQIIVGNGSNTYLNTTISSGTGINVASAAGSITINNTGDTNAADDITTSTTAGGDLSGTYPNPTVDGLQGVAVSTTAPTATNNILAWNGSAWAPANKGVPTGVIVMWSGTAAAIPGGWQICDGTNGTPNLLDKFILSVPASAYTAGQINQAGGASTVTLTTTQLPAHTHTGTSDATTPTFTGTAGSTSSVTPTFTGTANQSTSSVTPTFTGTANQTTSSVTPTFTGTANQTTSSVTPTFTGTANQSTSSVTPTFTGTANQTTSSVTPTFTGTANQSTSSVAPTFTGTLNQTTLAGSSHTHTFSVSTSTDGAHQHNLNTTTNYSGGGTRAFYGQNAGGGNDGITTSNGSHSHTVSGTTAAEASHTHTYTATGTVSSHTHTYTATGTISAVQLTYTASGTISAVQPTFTASGTISAVQPTFTATGTISAVQPTFTATGTISAVQPTFTATGSISTVGPLTYTPAGTVSSHTHTFTTGSTGTGSSFSILPPYYTLAYIMKL